MNYQDYIDETSGQSSSAQQKSLPENSVEYMLFLIDSKLEPRKRLAQLESIRQNALQLARKLTVDYIWQREEFNLELKNHDGLTYLHGITDHGDAVEDEWLIVHILREITKTSPSIWVRVADSDGEFLLIEAANVLPKWINPENDSYRVWMHDDKLLLIPVDGKAASSNTTLSISEAVQFLSSESSALIHSPFIEAEAFYRLGKYPDQIEHSVHHAVVKLPRKVAFILHTLPKSVAPAVEAFYLRDPIALRPLLADAGDLTFPPKDLVNVSVRFSKVLYAQLKSQRFDAPKRWEPLIQEIQASKLDIQARDAALARLDIGMKLTCGFEILSAKTEKSPSRVVRELGIELDDLREDGDAALPSNKEMAKWKEVERDDDDSWLDINYQDFERELGGEGTRSGAKSGASGFGDATTQADLRKIVSRFEAFLNDEDAGLDGAEMDVMDQDDDDDDDDGDDSDNDSEEDREVGFDEAEFSKMMREMMGLAPETTATREAVVTTTTQAPMAKPITKSDASEASDDNDDPSDIQELASQFEKELKGHGALKLDAPRSGGKELKGKDKDSATPASHPEGEGYSDEEVDIDYNLAKNLLESFKSQGGVSGPTGNLLGMMGIQLPRDEDDGEEDEKK